LAPVLLDTTVLIDLLRGRPDARRRLATLPLRLAVGERVGAGPSDADVGSAAAVDRVIAVAAEMQSLPLHFVGQIQDITAAKQSERMAAGVRAAIEGRDPTLSPRETEVLALLADGHLGGEARPPVDQLA
jgi:predicted nucleic acid-binding protein